MASIGSVRLNEEVLRVDRLILRRLSSNEMMPLYQSSGYVPFSINFGIAQKTSFASFFDQTHFSGIIASGICFNSLVFKSKAETIMVLLLVVSENSTHFPSVDIVSPLRGPRIFSKAPVAAFILYRNPFSFAVGVLKM